MKKVRRLVDKLDADADNEFRGLTDGEAAEPAISGGWSRKQILGHLIDSASNNHQRFVRALLADELRWPNYDQEGCVRAQHYQDAKWADLVRLWASYNRLLAHILARVPEMKAGTPCRIGHNPPMTLVELPPDYITHLEHHLQQIDRAVL